MSGLGMTYIRKKNASYLYNTNNLNIYHSTMAKLRSNVNYHIFLTFGIVFIVQIFFIFGGVFIFEVLLIFGVGFILGPFYFWKVAEAFPLKAELDLGHG